MNKIEILFLVLFFIKYIWCEIPNYYIKYIYGDQCHYITPANDEINKNLYLIMSCISGNFGMKRFSIFNGTSGRSIPDYDILTENLFFSTEILFAGKSSKYLFLISNNSIQAYDGNNLTDFLNISVNMGTFKIFNSSAIFAINRNNHIEINKLEYNEENLDIISIKNVKKEIPNISFISCDSSKDKNFYVCVYIYNINLFGISIISNEPKFLVSLERNSGEKYKYHETNFIKICYFKDSYKFISINSENDIIIRLRLFEYNKEQNRIIKDNYFDIQDTQLNHSYIHNDFMILDSKRLVKICAYENEIIISIIQFYDNGSKISVKIFKNIGLYFIGYSPFLYPRIISFQNSIVISSSVKSGVGYFFIGYPNSIDANINSNANINLRAYSKIQNNIFSFQIMFKIISIPDDFLFSNSLDYSQVNEGSYLNPGYELTFRQYKKDKKYTLIYQGIAIVDDYYNNNSYQIYPTGEKINDEEKSRILIEGRQCEITIEINSCNNGFYGVEDNEDLCTKVRHEGYYLENNIFKRCHPKCSECISGSKNDSEMQCLKCVDDYVLDKDTFNCISQHKQIISENIEKSSSNYFYIFLAIIILSLTVVLIYPFKDIKCCSKENKDDNDDKNDNDNDKKIELNKI